MIFEPEKGLQISNNASRNQILDALCKEIDCKWEEYSGGIYISKKFEREGEFPIVTINETEFMIREINRILRQRYTSTDKKSTTQILQSIIPTLSHDQLKMIDNQGIAIQSLNVTQQRTILQSIKFNIYSTSSTQWSVLEDVVKNSDDLKLSVKISHNTQILRCQMNEREFVFPINPSKDHVVDSDRIKKNIINHENSNSIFKDSQNYSINISESIKSHYISGAKIENQKEMIRLISNKNNWNFSLEDKGVKKHIRVYPKNTTTIVDALPLEYKTYFIGGNKNESEMKRYIQNQQSKLNLEHEILSNLIVDILKNKKEENKFNIFDKYIIIRFLLCSTMRQTIGDLLIAEMFPPEYLTDFEHAVLYRKMDGQAFSIVHPSGASLNVRLRRFPVPPKQ